MDATDLRARARQEADELGPESPCTEAEMWREERWGAVVPLVADDSVELLRRLRTRLLPEWTTETRRAGGWMRRPSLR